MTDDITSRTSTKDAYARALRFGWMQQACAIGGVKMEQAIHDRALVLNGKDIWPKPKKEDYPKPERDRPENRARDTRKEEDRKLEVSDEQKAWAGKINTMMQRFGMDARQLSKMMDVSYETVNRYRYCRRRCSPETQERMTKLVKLYGQIMPRHDQQVAAE